MKKTGIDEKQIREWMDAESWFTAAEAVEHGFADRIFDGQPVENRFDLTDYRNAPAKLTRVDPPAKVYDLAKNKRLLDLAATMG